MVNFLRDSFWGRVAYHLSGQKLFQHPEESKDYIVPDKYLVNSSEEGTPLAFEKSKESGSAASDTPSANPDAVMVSWEGEDDPENPYNWPIYQKAFFVFEIAFLTTSVYMALAIYTPAINELMEQFEIGQVVATLPLTLFVVGYGIGPMFFSPMSENAVFGRTSIYITTLFIFFILQIPTALSKNIAGLCILRFLSGFFASPCLATGGASVCDVLPPAYGPVGLAVWSMGAVCGPSLGPLIGAAMAVAGGWRWTFWFMAIISGSSFLVLGFLLPESYGKTLLLRKAKRLRKITGNQNLTTPEEIANRTLSVREVVIDTLWRPLEVSVSEPVVLMINIYISLIYSIMYLWFEAFPIVFYEVHHFTLVEMGAAYLSIIVGIVIAALIYMPVIYKTFTKKLLAGEPLQPEVFIPIAIVGSVLMPIGVFIFSWSSSAQVHWIGPMIGAAIFAAGAFLIFQTLFNYLGMSFWMYVASVFAGNAMFRSIIASVFPLFGKIMFDNLATDKYPVGWGSSILGFICVAMIAIPVLFYVAGPRLRARSKYSVSFD